MIAPSLVRVLPLLAIVAFSSGCDLTKLTANSTAGLFQRAAPAFEQHWDYDLAGAALPGNIVQMEGLMRVVPENEIIVMNGVRLYTAYAYGWIEDQVEEAQDRGDYDEANRLMLRARYMYQRSRDLAVHRVSLDHEGYQEAYDAGLDRFRAWLQEEFTEPEDAEGLLWIGYSWGSYINASKDDMVAVADLPFAQALVERSVELDRTQFNYAGMIFLAVVATSAPGADLEEAGPMWEAAIEATERKNLLLLVNMARTYAVKRQDRELYTSLLREVLEAGDINPEQRLTNMIAKRRAARYLRQIDERIPPQPEPAAAAPTPPTPPTPPATPATPPATPAAPAAGR